MWNMKDRKEAIETTEVVEVAEDRLTGEGTEEDK